ncbi:PREDICTED: PWWP domain-containing protein MUM1 [Ceratotherium simum simum]|uniref:PWWP domain-containing protein MUM1 n=1 Tax=Ceratotherium simum simum TaxID=73337 RepID=A0ABM1DI27_CERSS|nr:PREDICTED: PWWP domain-containing protein MUM1 [Ceratotherium simum simum]
MTDAKYVLCRWKKRSWPAKVLARPKASTKDKRKKEFFLNVQILSVDKIIRVKSTQVEILKKSHIDEIADLLGSKNEVREDPLEELTYRRSLRVALDVLNEGTNSCQESSSREERTAVSPREQPKELASSLCDPSSSSFLLKGMSGSCGPERRKRVDQRLSGLPACEKDPQCKVDHKKWFGKSEIPRALVLSAAAGGSQDGSGSRIHQEDRKTPSKRGRNSTQEPSLCQNARLLSEGDPEKERKIKAGSPSAPRSPPRIEEGLKAEGRDPGLPLGGPTLLLAPGCPDARGCPSKELCPDGSQQPGPKGRMTLRSAAKLGPPPLQFPAEETSNFHLLEEGKSPLVERGVSVLGEPQRVAVVLRRLASEPGTRLLHLLPDADLTYLFCLCFSFSLSFFLIPEPRSFEVGMLVWLKYQKYPFWPAVVKSVRRREKKASVLFIEGNMNPKGKGITVCLKRLKHFDCKEKHALLNEAKEDFDQAIGWCVSLITDYRVRLGCGSFAGSFLEYYAADISYPVRKSIQQDVLGTTFPQLSKGDPREPEAGSPQGRRQPCRKVLPDRSRAARDRANQKLVEYIVKARGTESHLRAILKNRKPSRWLKTFLNSSQYVTCVETYLEDEEQLDLVVKYLQGVFQEAGSRMLTRISGDRIRFILDVLLPEAIICAISAVDEVDYKTAEEKYIKGPSLSYREKEIFDNQLLEERNRRC